MKLKKINTIETPYTGINETNYQIEKRRLQLELLYIHQAIIKKGQRLAIVFEGRDAAGKGSTIKRHIENIIPSHCDIVALGVPTPSESKYWFRRYEKHLPQPGNMVFFDRSWYNRALIEPTMGYCTESQYRYFMKKVLAWEHKHIDNGLLLVKFYLSIDKETQMYRFKNRLRNPLTFWKFSENDLHARKKWEIFTQFKEQMFHYTSSKRSPWVVVNANRKKEARLTTLLYLVRLFGNQDFEPLTGEDVTQANNTYINKFSEQQDDLLASLDRRE